MINISTLLEPGQVAAIAGELSPAILEAKAAGAMLESVELVHGAVVRAYPEGVSAEHTRDRIFSSIGGSPVEMTGIVASNDIQARVIELGRTPGAKMPPSSALEEWAGVKIGDDRLAYVIARSIGRHGIEGRHVFQAVAERIGPAVRALFVKALAV